MSNHILTLFKKLLRLGRERLPLNKTSVEEVNSPLEKTRTIMKVLKNKAGQYFVINRGFVAANAAEATRLTDDDVKEAQGCMASLGINDSVTEDAPKTGKSQGSAIQNADGSSFAVRFVRPKDVKGDGSVAPRKRRFSPRRFRLESEAKHHGARFGRLEGHVGYIVQKVTEPVNAWINENNGKTNPEIGKARTDRV